MQTNSIDFVKTVTINEERRRILNAIQKIEEQSHKTRTPLFQDTLFELVRKAVNG